MFSDRNDFNYVELNIIINVFKKRDLYSNAYHMIKYLIFNSGWNNEQLVALISQEKLLLWNVT